MSRASSRCCFWSSPDRHMRRMVEQDVGRHQIGIDIEPDRGALLVLAGLFLELGHAVEPAEPGHAVEDPGELGMLADLALVEDDAAPGIDAAGDIGGGDVAYCPVELARILPGGDRVHVDHAIDALMRVLQPDPVQHRPEIIAEMEIAGRLHAGKDAGGRFHGRRLCRENRPISSAPVDSDRPAVTAAASL